MSAYFIGLMSGTSLDGVDAVLVDFSGPRFRVCGEAFVDYPAALREDILALQTPAHNELDRSARLANRLAQRYAQVVQQLLASCQLDAGAISAIACHGQTIRHAPERGYTLQLDHPALLAELTGIDVVADFRSRDVAAGGQGAPLVPAFHQAIFGRPDATVAVLNIGGMANVSILRPGDTPLGFDTGPGNALLDMWCDVQTGHAFDANGEWGSGGEVREDWLADALAEPFFHQSPPKSTGRDLFNADWLARWLAPHGLTDGPLGDGAQARDVQATLCELTARSAAQALREHAADASDVVVCGGGALKGDLMRRLSEQLPGVRVGRSDIHGLDVMQVEAAAFAWLAWTHLQRTAGNVPAVTGAHGPRVLGALYPAR